MYVSSNKLYISAISSFQDNGADIETGQGRENLAISRHT